MFEWKIDGEIDIEEHVEMKVGRIKPIVPSICFHGNDNLEILRLEPNGDIFVYGKLAENDKQVVDGLRDFLANYINSLANNRDVIEKMIDKRNK